MKSFLVSPTGVGWWRCARPPRAPSPARRGLFGGSDGRARSSREKAERCRERPKRRGRARATMWRRHDDRSAVSVTATVVRRGCTAELSIAFAIGILDLSFFSCSLSLSRLALAAYRIHRKVGDGGDVSSHTLARDVKTIVRNARVRNVLRFVSVKGNAIAVQVRPLGHSAVSRTGTRSSIELSVSR